jgi:hypothetical protein
MTSKKQIFIYRALVIVLGLLLTPGCVPMISPVSHKPGPISKLMQAADPPPLTPPPGKCLVFFHHPITIFTYGHTSVWEGTNFVAALANGQSTAVVYNPGKYVFSSRYGAGLAVVEANLLPDQIYDLAAFKYMYLLPVKKGDKEHDLVSQWMKEAIWIKRVPNVDAYETAHRDEVAQLIADFTIGTKSARLKHLAPDDHR